MAGPSGDPKLGVYAKPYIPQNYRRVFSLPAHVVHCTPPLTIDYAKYIRSFVGEDFLSVLSRPQTPRDDRPQSPTAQGEAATYSNDFFTAVRREDIKRQTELDDYALYGVEIHKEWRDESPNIYSLSVPGLREAGLRVDIGDVVYLRQLTFMFPNQLVDESNYVDEYGRPMPMLYIQHNASVWRVDRRREMLYLRIDELFHGSMRFNVQFTVQPHNTNATLRTLSDAQDQLHNGDWLRSMLYPLPADGIFQRTLNTAAGLLGGELNYEQSRAVQTVSSRNYGSVPYLVSGPPGTGKTKTVIAMALQLLQQDKKAKLILSAPSDPASDTLVERLSQHLKPQDLLRLNSPSRSFAEVPDTILSFCNIEEGIFTLPPFADLMRKRVVVVTCRDADVLVNASLTNRALFALQQQTLSTFRLDDDEPVEQPGLHWSGLIIDEAAQATEPEALFPLMVVAPPRDYGKKLPLVVMVGDQHQLGPRTASKDPKIQTSLFERLLTRPLYLEHPLARSKQTNGLIRPLTKDMLPIIRPPFTDLIRNYRSDPAILATPSSLFYNDTLEPAVQRTSPLSSWSIFPTKRIPVLFSDNRSDDKIERDGGGWYNPGEATLAMCYVGSLLSERRVQRQDEICIMSPFRAQVNFLRRMARMRGLHGVNIGPLEAFQGLEKRFVIVCTTRTRDRFIDQDIARGLGVIHEPRRFNVALTRAKEGLVVIGNPVLLVGDECWAAFIGFCKRTGAWTGDHAEDWTIVHKIKPSRLEKQMKWRSKAKVSSDNIKLLRKMRGFTWSVNFGMDEEEAFYESGVAAEAAVDGE